MRKIVSAAAAVFIVAGGAVSGCSAAGVGSCTPSADNPHESAGQKKKGNPGWMDAKGSVICNVELESLTGVVKMQKKVNGSWRDVPNTENSRTELNTKQNVKYVVMTRPFRCEKGVFRSAVRGSGVMKGRGSASLDWKYGNEVTNPCEH